MTNSEYEILNYIKFNTNVLRNDIITKLHPDKGENTFVNADARISALINLGLLSSEGNYLFLTPAGLHELDTYLDEQRRYEQIDSRSEEANKLAAEANKIANEANDQSEKANAIASKSLKRSRNANIISAAAIIISVTWNVMPTLLRYFRNILG